MYLRYSRFLVNRVNSLTKLSSVCMDRQTSAMPSNKLLSVIEDLNVLALDRKRLHSHTKQKTTIQDGNQPDGDSELRYYISPSKNHPQDILSTLHNNRGDPAYHVLSFSDINAFVIITHADGMFSRNFYRSFKIICSDD